MRRYLLIGSAAAALITLLAAPSAHEAPDRPDGRLVLALHPPERVAVMDVRSGRAVSRPLPGGTLCHGDISLIGGRAVFAGSAKGHGAEMSLDLALRTRAKPVGLADLSTPSATPGRLWLARVRYGRRGAELRSLREVTVEGRTTFVARRLPPAVRWFNLEGAVRDGLVLTSGGRMRVWDPRTGRVVRSMPEGFVLGLDDRRIAWCRGDCSRVHVSGPGGDRTFSLSRGGSNHGAFSPDGSHLAVSTLKGRIGLVDLATGSVRLVPRARTDTYGALGWAPSGKWLFFASPRGRLMAYSPAANRVTALPGRVRGNVHSLAAE